MSPIYDMKCPSCNYKIVDIFVHSHKDKVKCRRCKASMKRMVSSTSRHVGIKCFPAEGIYLEHVSPGGKTFYSEKEMRDFEKNTGTIIGRLH